jgi:hypothetical protein
METDSTLFPVLCAFDIGKGVTTMFLERATISELKMAFEHRRGRYIQEK